MVYGDSTGLRYRNKESDPMPIKTLNNNGLKVYEETEDYFIQIDKDAVITTVEKYVPGTSDIYNERLKDVERSRELLSLHKITWDANIDNAKLLLDVNKEQLERLANTPMLLLDEEVRPVLEARAIPTNYLCCFRVDKKTGEMYVSEAYENIIPNNISSGIISTKLSNGRYKLSKNTVSKEFLRLASPDKNFCTAKCVSDKVTSWFFGGIRISATPLVCDEFKSFKGELYDLDGQYYTGIWSAEGPSEEIVVDIMFTKTSTLKPFVKTIMPNGKLEFLSGATELTHTFLTKGDGIVTFGSGSFSLKGEKVLQLLVYEGLLTEQEKQAELAKDIRFRR